MWVDVDFDDIDVGDVFRTKGDINCECRAVEVRDGDERLIIIEPLPGKFQWAHLEWKEDDDAYERWESDEPLVPTSTFEGDLDIVLAEFKAFLMDKNAKYGNSALEPVRVGVQSGGREGAVAGEDGRQAQPHHEQEWRRGRRCYEGPRGLLVPRPHSGKEGVMSHKDWKGPGIYRCFNERGEWVCSRPREVDDLCTLFTYEKASIKAPKPPEPELTNGVYVVRTKGHYNPDVFLIGLNELKDGKWNRKPGPNDTILGRIPIEEVDQ
jgi:hypothetical protein